MSFADKMLMAAVMAGQGEALMRTTTTKIGTSASPSTAPTTKKASCKEVTEPGGSYGYYTGSVATDTGKTADGKKDAELVCALPTTFLKSADFADSNCLKMDEVSFEKCSASIATKGCCVPASMKVKDLTDELCASLNSNAGKAVTTKVDLTTILKNSKCVKTDPCSKCDDALPVDHLKEIAALCCGAAAGSAQ